MNVLTKKEARDYIRKNAWASGLEMSDRDDISYGAQEEASCIRLNYPETPLRVTYAARLLSMLGTFADESRFNGALLWLRLWNIGSAQLEKSGWKMVERMRMGFGELRPLGEANVHWFRSDEVAELAAFIVPCFVYGWDAYVMPSTGDCFGFISHDEYWDVVARNQESRERLLAGFADFKPRADLHAHS
jgi:hypothetical protein